MSPKSERHQRYRWMLVQHVEEVGGFYRRRRRARWRWLLAFQLALLAVGAVTIFAVIF